MAPELCLQSVSRGCVYRHPGLVSLSVQSPNRSHFSHAVRRSLELPGQPCPLCNMATNCAPGLWGLRKTAQGEPGQILRTCDLHRQLSGNVCVVCAHIYPRGRVYFTAITETTGSALYVNTCKHTHMCVSRWSTCSHRLHSSAL